MKNEKFYIIRTFSAGVWFGNKTFIPAEVFYQDENQKGKQSVMVITNARRLWYWVGAASLSQLATEGTKTPGSCKFTVTITDEDGVYLPQIIEMLPCTKEAVENIKAVKEWKI